MGAKLWWLENSLTSLQEEKLLWYSLWRCLSLHLIIFNSSFIEASCGGVEFFSAPIFLFRYIAISVYHQGVFLVFRNIILSKTSLSIVNFSVKLVPSNLPSTQWLSVMYNPKWAILSGKLLLRQKSCQSKKENKNHWYRLSRGLVHSGWK